MKLNMEKIRERCQELRSHFRLRVDPDGTVYIVFLDYISPVETSDVERYLEK
jgi:hypothetical protein